MLDDQGTRKGYLVLADLAGYTKFLTGTELEHAQAIIRELTTLIRSRLVPPMRFVKLEGDAVFCYVNARAFEDGERLVEVLEACYYDFSGRLFDMERETTCRCDACAQMSTLDLKFAVHFGTFIVEEGDGAVDLAGPDVILAHRLLKNGVTERLGCRAYVLFTDSCLARMPASFPTQAHTETYESFGDVSGGVHDLKTVLVQMREAVREYVTSEDADFVSTVELPYPPAFVWQYYVDPGKRLRWQGAYQTGVEKQPNEQGRTGLGSTSHCDHADGKEITRHYVDWRPFQYFTVRFAAPEHRPDQPFVIPSMTETTDFMATDDGGTIVHYRARIDDRSDETLDEYRRVLMPLQRAQSDQAKADLLSILGSDSAFEGQKADDTRVDA